MTQFQFDMICTIIQNGAPALAPELIEALSNVIQEANAAAKENAALKEELAHRDACCEEPNHCDGKCSCREEKDCEVCEG